MLGPALCALLALSLAAQDETRDEPGPQLPPPSFASAAESDPTIPREVIVNEPGAFDGLTLFEPLNGRAIYAIDLDGTVVHRWETDSSPGGWLYLQDDGTLLRCGREDEDPHFHGGGIGGRVQRLAPDGGVLWEYDLARADLQQHHDIEPLPNGNLLLIAWERITRAEAVARGRDPEQVSEEGLWPDTVLEIEPTPPEGGRVVWQWRVWDHLVQDVSPTLPDYAPIGERPGRVDVNGEHRDRPPPTAEEIADQEALEAGMEALGYVGSEEEDEQDDARGGREEVPGDWLHTNAVDYLAGEDLIVLSSPSFSELWVIDHSTTTAEAATGRGGRRGHGGDLLWRWGNPRMYGAGDEADRTLFFQDDPTWLPGSRSGELRLLAFNNGHGRPDGDWSSVEELVLPFDPEHGFAREPGKPWGPAAPVWTYADRDGFHSAFISGAQRLANGNTLVCSGAAGRIFEVTPAGAVVWDFYNPYGGEIEPPDHAGKAPPLALFRATRLARDHPGVKALLAAD